MAFNLRGKSGATVTVNTSLKLGEMREGASKEKAARIAQSRTGQALATGKPPRRKGRRGH